MHSNAGQIILGYVGGALELSMCSFHMVQWHFMTQGAPIQWAEAI